MTTPIDSQGTSFLVAPVGSPGALLPVTGCANLQFRTGSANVVDTTTVEDPAATKRQTLLDEGQCTFRIWFNPSDPAHALLVRARIDRVLLLFRIVLTDEEPRTTFDFTGYVLAVPAGAAANGVVESNVVVEITGAVQSGPAGPTACNAVPDRFLKVRSELFPDISVGWVDQGVVLPTELVTTEPGPILTAAEAADLPGGVGASESTPNNVVGGMTEAGEVLAQGATKTFNQTGLLYLDLLIPLRVEDSWSMLPSSSGTGANEGFTFQVLVTGTDGAAWTYDITHTYDLSGSVVCTVSSATPCS